MIVALAACWRTPKLNGWHRNQCPCMCCCVQGLNMLITLATRSIPIAFLLRMTRIHQRQNAQGLKADLAGHTVDLISLLLTSSRGGSSLPTPFC